MSTANPYSVAQVLKLYFESLVNPLLTHELYDDFLISELINKFILITKGAEGSDTNYLKQICGFLPPGNKETAKMVFQLLHKISKSKSAEMTAKELAQGMEIINF